jgi:hypothetical protein
MAKSYCRCCDTRFNKEAFLFTLCPVCKTPNVKSVLPAVFAVNRSIDLDWLDDEEGNGTNLSYENALKEHKLTCDDEECRTEDHNYYNEVYDGEEDTILLGAWKFNGEVYEPDETKEYAAIKQYLGGAPLVTVVWSKELKGFASMCSPCCPNQIDGDSGEGKLLGYALPEDAAEV